MIAVGGHYVSQLPPLLVRAASTLGGGLGGSQEELCGVLSAGALVLGALYGRDEVQDDAAVYALVRTWRQRFAALNAGQTQCALIRAGLPEVAQRCQPVVSHGARLLVELIAETESRS